MSEKIEELRTELFNLRMEAYEARNKIDEKKTSLEREYIDHATTEILRIVAETEDCKRREAVFPIVRELARKIKSLNMK